LAWRTYGRTDTQESHVQLVCAMVAAGEHRRALDHVQALRAADGGGVAPTLPMLSYVMRGVARQVRARSARYNRRTFSSHSLPLASRRRGIGTGVANERERWKFCGGLARLRVASCVASVLR